MPEKHPNSGRTVLKHEFATRDCGALLSFDMDRLSAYCTGKRDDSNGNSLAALGYMARPKPIAGVG